MSEARLDLVAVVDTDPAGLQATSRALRDLDCRVVGFASASLAEAQITARVFDLVVDARHARGGRAGSLARQLRERMGPACPVLALLHSPPGDPEDALDYDAVWMRPTRAFALLAAIDLARLARARRSPRLLASGM